MRHEQLSSENIRRITSIQRALLIDHIDGPVMVRRGHDRVSRQRLLTLGLIQPFPIGTQSRRPQATVSTMEGRRVMAIILGQYADALADRESAAPIKLQAATTLKALERLREYRRISSPVPDAIPPETGALAAKEA
jgi:hypothetical protein